ncbi:hypothetical protein [Mycobacterium phage WXIN]|nr:hypothetical protein [Mycobacterium phage WXIN]
MKPGDDAIIDFEGIDHLGHIDSIEKGWARCTMSIDPYLDYGSGTERLAPHQTVMVPLGRVRPRE